MVLAVNYGLHTPTPTRPHKGEGYIVDRYAMQDD